MAGCKSPPKNEIVLPPFPERQEQQMPEDLKDYAQLLLYYEFLVEEWEVWGQTVTELIDSEDGK